MILEPKGHIDMAQPVYRYMPYQYLIEFLKNGTHWISNINKWEDPYENYFSTCTVIDQYGERASRITFPLYGQSWTLKRESDAMWRIYSVLDKTKGELDKSRLGIRIKSYPYILQRLPANIFNANLGYLGPVTYISQEDIDSSLSNLQFKNWPEYWNKREDNFFIKRKEFKHEEEFRIIFSCFNEADNGNVYAKISPLELIKEITFDPRLSISDYDKYRKELIELGFPAASINKSQLYSFQPQTITVL